MAKLWNSTTGYVKIKVQALGLEGVLNDAVREGLKLADVRRLSYTVVVCKLSWRDYLYFKKLFRDRVELRVLECRGVPRLLIFLYTRWWLPVGCAICILAIAVISQLCLDIQITGLETIKEYTVYQTLVENGARTFAFKSTIDLKQLERAVEQTFPKISYVHASFEGVRLVLTVDEGALEPELLDTSPASIVAKKGGVVQQVIAREGKAMVEEGQVVQAGDVLISGDYVVNEIPFRVSARGNVTAKVDYIGRSEASFDPFILEPTGNEAQEVYMRLGKRIIKVRGENPYTTYIEEAQVDTILGENFPVYVEMLTVTYKEAKKVPSEDNKETAILQAREAAYYQALGEIDNTDNIEIQDFHSFVEEEEGKVRVTATISAIEEIGEKQSLVGVPPPVVEKTEEEQ